MHRAILIIVTAGLLTLTGCASMSRPAGSAPLKDVLLQLRSDLKAVQADPKGPATNLCLDDVQVVLKITAEQKTGAGLEVAPLKFSADVTGSMENTITLNFKPNPKLQDTNGDKCASDILLMIP